MNVARLCELFNSTLGKANNTVLLGGFDEPFYQASKGQGGAQIQFRADYVTSAMHELSHWCIAGNQRLAIDDYGYWYAPDGRNEQQQKQFEQVEIKPQALEWLFCNAAGIGFRLSLDNLDGNAVENAAFATGVRQQALRYLQGGISPRGAVWLATLSQATGNQWSNPSLYAQQPRF